MQADTWGPQRLLHASCCCSDGVCGSRNSSDTSSTNSSPQGVMQVCWCLSNEVGWPAAQSYCLHNTLGDARSLPARRGVNITISTWAQLAAVGAIECCAEAARHLTVCWWRSCCWCCGCCCRAEVLPGSTQTKGPMTCQVWMDGGGVGGVGVGGGGGVPPVCLGYERNHVINAAL